MQTKAEKYQGFASQVAIPAVCSLVVFCLLLSSINRLIDFFFISSSQRYLIIFSFFITSGLFFYFIWRFSKLWNFQRVLTFLENNLLSFAIALIVTIAILFSGLIPIPKIPINHTLEIHALPTEDVTGNAIFVQKIIETIDAPRIGSIDVDFDQLRIEGGRYQRNPDSIELKENAVLSYKSFYSGCISILFSTSPESKHVQVRFDMTVDKYSLNSPERAPTTIALCSPIPVQYLSFKWKIIVLGLYLADFISIFALVNMLIFPIYFLRFNEGSQSSKIQYQLFLYLSTGIMVVSAIFQIGRIVFFPDETITHAPPAKPPSVAGKLTMEAIYKKSLHRKKFTHSFIYLFMDIYPKLDAVYVSGDTLDAFDFYSQKFNWWFEAYNPLPAEQMPTVLDETEIDHLINGVVWSSKEIMIEEINELITLKFSDIAPEKYVLVTNRGNVFYLLSDSLLEESRGKE